MSTRTQPRPISTARRLSHVQIPASPFRTPSSSRVMATPTAPQQGSDQENTPVPKQRPSMSPTRSSYTSAAQLKRKRSEHDLSLQGHDVSSPKKQKVLADVTPRPKASPAKKTSALSKTTATGEDPNNASEEFPNGSFYCHQCARKKDVQSMLHLHSHREPCLTYSAVVLDGIQCTIATPKGRCKSRYCKPCLSNRYELDFDDILADGVAHRTKEHVKGTAFIWKCVILIGY